MKRQENFKNFKSDGNSSTILNWNAYWNLEMFPKVFKIIDIVLRLQDLCLYLIFVFIETFHSYWMNFRFLMKQKTKICNKRIKVGEEEVIRGKFQKLLFQKYLRS